MSDRILTYTKVMVNPLNASTDDIHIEDIAHSLSLMTRANGHFKYFYSVGQHAINCFKEARCRGYSEKIQLGCLLHDAHESYISDLTRPVKKHLPEYHVFEKRLHGLIYEKFGLGDLTGEEELQIREIDDTLLYYEFLEIMDFKVADTEPFVAMKHDFVQRDFNDIESEFIMTFKILTNSRVFDNRQFD